MESRSAYDLINLLHRFNIPLKAFLPFTYPGFHSTVGRQRIYLSHLLFPQVRVSHQNDSFYNNVSSVLFRYIVLLNWLDLALLQAKWINH